MKSPRRLWPVLLLLIILPPTLCCGGIVYLRASGLGMCFDIVSGKVPYAALERHIDLVLQAAIAEDYEWLASIGTRAFVIDELTREHARLTEPYTIEYRDNLAGGYEYDVVFADNSRLKLGLMGQWPECPDRDVTDAEIFTYIYISSIRLE